ncbi:Serine/threonine-protein kinase TOR [Glycine max]|nr:Serine/threonine-protein kinase TOR [Glycine max]
MATASQSHRYIGPPSVAPGPGDALNRILADLCTRGNPKEGASLALKKHLEEEARDISGEAFSRFMDQLYDRISGLLDSSDVAENLGALRAIDELIDVALGENASKVSRFSSYMRIVFDTKRDPEILVLASRVLGHLARAGGAMTADEVERQVPFLPALHSVKIALDWLRGNRVEYRRFAAVLILKVSAIGDNCVSFDCVFMLSHFWNLFLAKNMHCLLFLVMKEMAENASTVFNVHVPEFVDAIWVALRDPVLPVRERAVEALRACLRVIEKRETRWRVQWYYRMFEATQDGLGKNAPVHSIHGSLLAVGELLRKNDELRKDAVDALCCLAHALGEDFTIFIPSIHKLLQKYRLRHKEFEEIEGRLQRREPLILGITASQRLNRRLPVEVISDPLDDVEIDPYEDGSDAHKLRDHQVNDGRLRTAGEASQRSTKEDWAEWMRHFSIQLLKESPSPALRTCARLAQLQPFVGRELFAAGFVSCWAQLNETSQKQLVQNLEMAFSSPNIPPEILATLLNLAEFMEHDEKPLPIDIRLLGALAEKCRAFAKALHYKEMEFEGARSKKMDANPVAVVEVLIHINSQLHQHEAALGILTYAQQHLDFQLKESWYEKLQRWDDALKAYTAKASQATSPHLVLDATLGKMRCLAALAQWDELNILCKEFWTPAEPAARLEMAPMAASAAWNMGEWDQMAEYVSRLDDGDETKLRGLGNTAASSDGSSSGTFFRAVLLVRRGKYDEAREYVERARKCLATELAALVLESYERAYSNMVRVQQLSELEEVIDYRTLPIGNRVADERRALIRNMWTQRIEGAKSNVEVWQALLAVRALVLPPVEDVESWLKFASLCRKSGRLSQAKSTLVKLLQYDPEKSPENVRYHGPPQVMLAYLKYQWSLGEDSKRREAFIRLQNLAMELSSAPNIQPVTPSSFTNGLNLSVPLLARVYLNLGSWQWSLSPGLVDESIKDILNAFTKATQYANKWAKAWHKWALFNTAVMSHYTLRGFPDVAAQFVAAAVTGYFHSIACAANSKGVDDSLQDILRLLTLWFNHGATAEVQMALKKGFSLVNINTWLVVLPQIIARIHSNNHAVRELIQSLLVRIGQNHPQALMYPLLVACKSISNLRKAAAQEVVDKVRQHSGVLVDQAQLVSKELIRVAILWHEMWHEALEEASRLYFGEHNIEGMLNVLEPLHEMLEEGAMKNNVTIKERIFIEAYRQELLEAYECCMNYKRTGKDAELTQAWDIYYHVFRKIDKQLQSLTTLDLESVSPELLECRNLELAVPGSYRADAPVVTIASFARQLVVITSKQRPRKLTIHGSDGDDYAFLLKGHEDLRQDERVMQLFGLVNTLLENSPKTAEKDLSIQRYAVIPLSPNSGLIEWVPNCDTLHHLIREYRDARKITLNQEHKCMLSFAPDYDHLPLIAKVEVFEHALHNTEGNDLARVLWLKSRTSEIWLERRTNYTRSLAVMSMVGYLLGLGDRHPSNLMLHRFSGKILHIDFGDCFEASMNREKFPEKVPFRLTRMLVKAMEVSGIEGNFRSTCENVMQVLRTNKDSVMAMMEAFVHDPLINWRLFNFNEVPQMSMLTSNHVPPVVNSEESAPNRELPHPQRGARERELLQAVNQLGDANEVLNERAVVVMARMSNKLTGRDFSTCSSVSNNSLQHAVDHSSLISGDTREVDHALSVKLQVQKLIIQASSYENLCQNYVVPFLMEMELDHSCEKAFFDLIFDISDETIQFNLLPLKIGFNIFSTCHVIKESNRVVT